MRRIFPLLIIMIFSTLLVVAEDDQGNNDPNDNERANACYNDGSLEGKCDTAWEWICGWHLIRFEEGILSREEFPPSCASLLPPEIEPDTPEIIAGPTGPGCLPFFTWYVDFNGGDFLPSGTVRYSDPSCKDPDGTTWLPLVHTLNGGADADLLCDTNSPHNFGSHIGDGVYYCGPI